MDIWVKPASLATVNNVAMNTELHLTLGLFSNICPGVKLLYHMARGARWAVVHGVTTELDMT